MGRKGHRTNETGCQWGANPIITATFGIQVVMPGSPAERYGLQPGTMIVAVNGRAMTDDTVMVEAIQLSGGRMDLEVLAQGSDQPQPLTVILDVVRRSAF